jgi:hypothetical protein
VSIHVVKTHCPPSIKWHGLLSCGLLSAWKWNRSALTGERVQLNSCIHVGRHVLHTCITQLVTLTRSWANNNNNNNNNKPLNFWRVRMVPKRAYELPSCPSVRPSVRPRVSMRLQLDGAPWNLILDTSIKICRQNRKLVTTGPKYRVLYMETWQRCIVAGNINSP